MRGAEGAVGSMCRLYYRTRMRKHIGLVIGYSALAVLAVGIPVYGLFAGKNPLAWSLALAGALTVTLYLTWVYRWWIDFPGWSILSGSRGRPQVALTFDDGPNGETTEAILDILREHRVHATFFCVGEQVARFPDLVARMAAEGHQIGNHTHSHRKLAWASPAEIAGQIDRAQSAILAVGAPMPRLFRAPHGFKSVFLRGVLAQRNMSLCAWSHCLRDFERPGAQTLVRRAQASLRNGAILLLHDGGGDRRHTVEALPGILAACREQGLTPVTIDELVGHSVQGSLRPALSAS